jgi:hypothetical protein
MIYNVQVLGKYNATAIIIKTPLKLEVILFSNINDCFYSMCSEQFPFSQSEHHYFASSGVLLLFQHYFNQHLANFLNCCPLSDNQHFLWGK